MPKLTEERWEGINWLVEKGSAQKANPDGTPMVIDGEPAMVDLWVFTIIMDTPATGDRLIVRIPFEDAARQLLIERLTGGVVVPPKGAVHLPFGPGNGR